MRLRPPVGTNRGERQPNVAAICQQLKVTETMHSPVYKAALGSSTLT